jgi:hypothetical protein
VSLRDLKGFLLFVMLIGAAAYFGGGATLASFSAEATNAGSAIASGTLTMSDQVNAGTVCFSASAAPQNNTNPSCPSVLALTNLAPGVFGGVALVTVQNTGSIDASKLSVFAPLVNATLRTALTTSGPITSLPITALEGTVATNDQIVLSFGTQTQTFTASGPASGGATSIPVNSLTPNYAYPANPTNAANTPGTTVSDSSSDTNSSNTDCYDVKTSAGTALNFNPTTGNPFCQNAVLYLQETTGGKYYCWVGLAQYASQSNGLCTAPISVNLATPITSGTAPTTLTVTALNGNVNGPAPPLQGPWTGDSIVITQGSNTETCTATASAPFGSTTIAVSCPSAAVTYTTSAVVTDSSSLAKLNNDTTDAITSFDTFHSQTTGRIYMPPVSASGTLDTPNPVELAKSGGTRTFEVGAYVPGPAVNQNFLQGLQSTFGLTWHIDQ